MKRFLPAIELGLSLVLTVSGVSCVTQSPPASNSIATAPTPTPTPAVSPSPASGVVTTASTVPVTLPVLDALFADEAFKAELKSKLQLTDDQISGLRKSASDEVAKLRQVNAEQQEGGAAEARDRAAEKIRGMIGEGKTEELFALAREHWLKGSEDLEAGSEAGKGKEPEVTMLPGPNAVPGDTRIIVNIPAYRMDFFREGSLVKSYKVGIGYPQFPLPTGLRKAQTIIFNPTWTPPDEPWVASMKDVTVGEKIAAGSPLNPLGPIKIPIGMPSLIHGGKPLSKIGTFASHGCVGLTNAQVKDFALLLATTAGKKVSDKTIGEYLKDPTKTRVLKLDEAVPVELRYETIVVADGKLHIYRDVYDQDTNTEENLRTALEKHSINLDDLSADERTQALEALNALSSHPKKQVGTKTADANGSGSPTTNANASPEISSNRAAMAEVRKTKTVRRKPIGKNQKEVIIEIAALSGKGYPAPVDLDTGSGKPARKSGQTVASQ